MFKSTIPDSVEYSQQSAVIWTEESKGTFYSEDVGKMVKMPFIRTFFFAPEESGKFKMMNGTDKIIIFSFFCISKINL